MNRNRLGRVDGERGSGRLAVSRGRRCGDGPLQRQGGGYGHGDGEALNWEARLHGDGRRRRRRSHIIKRKILNLLHRLAELLERRAPQRVHVETPLEERVRRLRYAQRLEEVRGIAAVCCETGVGEFGGVPWVAPGDHVGEDYAERP